MISNENKREIFQKKVRKTIELIIPWLIFFVCFILSNILELQYSDSTSLFNDKLIDVSSIFFGIFVGCLYLFDKFKSNHTYERFIKFCKSLLYLNIIIITLSFIIILINNKLPEFLTIHSIIFYPRVLIFSFYIALFAVTLYKITQFSRMIFIILKR